MKRVYKPNLVPATRVAIIHLGGALPHALERPTRKRRLSFKKHADEQPALSFPYLALHREEFAWPPTVASRRR